RETAGEMRRQVEGSLERLGIDHLELFALHGINTREIFQRTIRAGGPLSALFQMQREGLIGHIGYSGHAPLPLQLEMIGSDLFSFVNLHYYAFRAHNRSAVDLAASKDMGVFIISPNDKGGKLYAPSSKLQQLTHPLHPAVWNERWLLSQPDVHTLSIGLSKPEEISLHLRALEGGRPFWSKTERVAEARLDSAAALSPLERCGGCIRCLPCPEHIEIPDLLRLLHLSNTYDMQGYGVDRYAQMQPDDHWMPGAKGSLCTDCGECLDRCPLKLDIPALVREAHARFEPSAQ
ncbi:MAG: aldo/keto reductase, partial [Magnetococcales bacterium]|nr:aldo/keto reductase [Magnetococcales bacterium]